MRLVRLEPLGGSMHQTSGTRSDLQFTGLSLTVLVATMTVLLFFPAGAVAQTSGPTQTEFQSYGSSDVTDMVNLFTGDLGYNIPLFELPGPNGSFPFVLTYQSSFSMTQEASWVGLGWNLSGPGVISREVRGLPDDYSGAEIHITRDIMPSLTFGVGFGAGVEVFGGDTKKGLGLSAGIQTRYNNYRGVGFGRNFGLNAPFDVGLTGRVGLNFSLDSQEGTSVTPSVSLGHTIGSGDNTSRIGGSLSGPINSRTGLTDITLGMRYTPASLRKDDQQTDDQTLRTKETARSYAATPIAGSSTVWSFANPAHSPFIRMEMEGVRTSGSFKVGGSAWGVHPNMTISAFASLQRLKNRQQRVSSEAYGYLYLHEADANDTAVLDFNRGKDGILREETPNLPAPVLTHDIYRVTGDGMGGTFRAYRSDVGILFDQRRSSTMWGGSSGFEIGAGGISHWGADGDITNTESIAGQWTEDNEIDDEYEFKGFDDARSLYEPYYFRFVGEPTLTSDSYFEDPADELASVGGERAVRVVLEDGGFVESLQDLEMPDREDFRIPRYSAEARLVTSAGQTINAEVPDRGRTPRATQIQSFTNLQLKNFSSALPEFSVEFIAAGEEDRQKYVRAELPDSHIGGFIITGPDGTRRVYALPVYNYEHVERQFSVDGDDDWNSPSIAYPTDDGEEGICGTEEYQICGTDRYSNKKELTPYVTAYLLTSILGPDYVDADAEPGPSVGDFGHYVEFTYQRTTNSYHWRAPFEGANFNPGYRNHAQIRDDRGSVMWGTKEVWYLREAETKTHIAEFQISERLDGKGAEDAEFGGVGESSASSYRLDRINLFSKSDPDRIPVKTIHFSYSYTLVPGAPNYENAGESADAGKLTLDSLAFTYQGSNRGRLSPYRFEYGANPRFQDKAQDRWGTYRPYEDFSTVRDLPYTKFIDPSLEGQDTASLGQTLDENAAAWHLRGVTLPSGGQIEIDYESDDYAYVQNKPATEMFSISAVSTEPSQLDLLVPCDPDVNSHAVTSPPDRILDLPCNPNLFPAPEEYRRVFFELEEAIPAGNNARDELEKYFSGLDQIYFKVRMHLKTPDDICAFQDAFEGCSEYVAGYAEIEKYGLAEPQDNVHTEGWVQLAAVDNYHPFSVAAWQHLRLNQPELLAEQPPFDVDPEDPMAEQIAKAILLAWPVATVSPQVVEMMNGLKELFRGFNGHAWAQDWGQSVDLDSAWVRLNTPDGRKYGGGARVNRITFSDAWDESASPEDPQDPDEPSQTVGQVFRYEMEDGTSSGVASYEPVIGGEENAWRTAEHFTDDLTFASDYNLFFEHPVNESYFPAPQVGYRRVVVRSIAAENVLGGKLKTADLDPQVPTTGQTVHEFYTAKDFPTRLDQTEIDSEPFKLWVPVPLIGSLVVENLTASQGYAIVLNDMHGKRKAVSQYGIDPTGSVRSEPVKTVRYRYHVADEFEWNDGIPSFDLQNVVDVIEGPRPRRDLHGLETDSLRENQILGREHELVVDMRQKRVTSMKGGVNLNVDVLMAVYPVPVPVPWPNIGLEFNEVRTAVVNRIIHKTGILKEIEENDGGAVTTTRNLAFDGYTGRPVLTSVNNSFGEPVFSFDPPAYWYYDGMGPAFRNQGVRLRMTLPEGTATSSGDGAQLLQFALESEADLQDYSRVAADGDEFALSFGDASRRAYLVDASVDGEDPGLVLSVEGPLPENLEGEITVNALLVRSGRRNQLNAAAGQLRALTNPLKEREFEACQVTDSIPCGVSYVETTIQRPTTCAAKLFAAYGGARRYMARPSNPQITADLRALLDPCRPQTLDDFDYDDRSTTLARVPLNSRVRLQTEEAEMSGVLVERSERSVILQTDLASGTAAGGGEASLAWDSLTATWVRAGDYGRTGSVVGGSVGSVALGAVGFALGDDFLGTKFSSGERLLAAGISAGVGAVLGYLTGRTVGESIDRWEPTLVEPDPVGQDYWAGCGVSLLDPGGEPIPLESVEKFAGLEVRETPENALATHPQTGHRYAQLEVEVKTSEVRTALVYSDCRGWTETVTVDRPVTQYCPATSTELYTAVDDVLEATAVRFSHSWPQTFEDVRFAGSAELENQDDAGDVQLLAENGYASGQLGIWRPRKSYTYLDERRQSDPVDMSNDGAFDDVRIFKWGSESLDQCAPKWQWTEEITRYSPYSFEKDRKNNLDIHTAALHGYRGSVNTAYATNARHDEIGFEGFEEYTPNAEVNEDNLGTGNITFGTVSHTESVTMESPEIFDVWVAEGGVVVLDSPCSSLATSQACADPLPPDWQQTPATDRIVSAEIYPDGGLRPDGPGLGTRIPVHSSGYTNDGKPFLVLGGRTGWQGADMRRDTLPEPGALGERAEIDSDLQVHPDSFGLEQSWTGKVKIFRERVGGDVFVLPRRVATVDVVDEKAHTGSNSLKFSESAVFWQKDLNLEPEKRYVLSAWVSRDDIDRSTFRTATEASEDDLGIQVLFRSGMTETEHDQFAVPAGPIIEGWQKVEIEFTVPSALELGAPSETTLAPVLGLRFQNGDDSGEPSAAYFDDIRIFPATANMESYVYDPGTYRLIATLDNNNFATLYGYDGEGSLHLVKKETVRGIYTVREIRAHTRQHPR